MRACRTTIFGCLLACALLSPSISAGDLDSYALHIREASRARVTWQNVDDCPEWVAGAKPTRFVGQLWYAVNLPARQSVTIRVPARSLVKCIPIKGTIANGDLHVTRSTGTNLFVTVPMIPTDDQRGLVTVSSADDPALVRMENAAQHQQPICLALFISQLDLPNDSVRYPLTICLLGQTVCLSTSEQRLSVAGSRPASKFLTNAHALGRFPLPDAHYSPLTGSMSFAVNGPTRLQIEVRHLYQPDEPASLDAVVWSTMTTSPMAADSAQCPTTCSYRHALPLLVETNRTTKLNGGEVTISRPAFLYLDVPMGSQQVTLASNQAGNLVRVRAQQSPDYRMPKYNLPINASSYVSTNRSPHPWSMTDDDVRMQRAATVSQLQAVGNQAGHAVDVEQALLLADRIGRDNRFRDGGLLADQLLRQLAGRFPHRPELAELVELLGNRYRHRHVLLPKQLSESEAIEQFIVDRQILSAGDYQLAPNAAAQSFQQRQRQPIRMPRVPGGGSPWLIALPERSTATQLEVSAASEQQSRIFIQLDDQAPVICELRPTELPEAEFQASITLAQPATPRTMALSGRARIDLPANARQLRVWTDCEKPVFANVSVLMGSMHRLDAKSAREVIARVQARQATQSLFARWLSNPDSVQDLSFDERELINQWADLRRLLEVRSQLFWLDSDVPGYLQPTAVGGVTFDESQRSALLARAQRAEQQQQWANAIEAWSQLARSTDHTMRVQAESARAVAFAQLGEIKLATRILKSLYRNAADDTERSFARQRLVELFARHDDLDSYYALVLLELQRQPNADNIERAANLLLVHRQPRLAWYLASLVPGRPLAQQVAQQASIKLGWVPNTRDSNQSSPLEVNEDESSDEQTTIGWWQQVVQAAGFAEVEYLTTERRATFARIEPSTPCVLRPKVVGRVRLEVRMLHPYQSNTPADDWLAVQVDGRVRLIPMLDQLPNQHVRVIGEAGVSVGGSRTVDVDITNPNATIALSSERSPMIVRIVNHDQLDLGWPNDLLAIAQSNRPNQADLQQFVLQEQLTGQGDWAGALKVLTGSSAESASRTMALIYRQVMQTGKIDQLAIVHAIDAFTRHPHAPNVASIYRRVAAGTEWEHLTNISRHAGIRRVNVAGWNPESPLLRATKSLIPNLSSTSQVVYGQRRIVLALNCLQPKQMVVAVRPINLSEQPNQPISLHYQVNDIPAATLALSDTTSRQRFAVNLPPGQHELRFWLAQPLPDQYVEVDVFDGSASAFEPQPRDYVVATETEPVVLDVEGPCSLRVDELVGSETQVRYIPVTAHGPQRIAIKPDPGQAEMFVRVFQRVPSAEAMLPAPPMLAPPTIAFTRTGTFIDPTNPQGISLERVADSYQQLRALDPQALRTAFADFDAGTWSLHADYRRRFAFDEDQLELASTAKNQVEQFGELRAAYQRLDRWTGTYRQLELLAREREVGGNTFGARYHWQHSPADHPMVYQFDASLFGQDPGEAQSLNDASVEWAGRVRGLLGYTFAINETWQHRLDGSLFARFVTAERGEYRPVAIDQDVFTGYKHDHLAGWELGDTLIGQPFVDTQWWARIAVLSNEDMRTLERASAMIGWKQLLRHGQLNASLRVNQFFSDRDRADAINRQLLDVEWLCPLQLGERHRVELSLASVHDFSRDQTSVLASLALQIGQPYRDLHPKDIDFRKQKRFAHQQVGTRSWWGL